MQWATLYHLFGLNPQIFYWINSIHTPWLDQLMLLGTALGDFKNILWILGGYALWLLAIRLRPSLAQAHALPRPESLRAFMLHLLLTYIIAAAIVSLLKVGLHMPRPYLALPAGSVQVLAQPESPYSFPSGHSTFAMLVACCLWPHARCWQRLLLGLCVLWIGVSRISVGVHFPVDVLTGYLCGLGCTWLASRLLQYIQPSSAPITTDRPPEHPDTKKQS